MTIPCPHYPRWADVPPTLGLLAPRRISRSAIGASRWLDPARWHLPSVGVVPVATAGRTKQPLHRIDDLVEIPEAFNFATPIEGITGLRLQRVAGVWPSKTQDLLSARYVLVGAEIRLLHVVLGHVADPRPALLAIIQKSLPHAALVEIEDLKRISVYVRVVHAAGEGAPVEQEGDSHSAWLFVS